MLSYTPDRTYFNYLDRVTQLNRDHNRYLNNLDFDRHRYHSTEYESDTSVLSSPICEKCVNVWSSFCNPLGGSLMAASGVMLGTANAVSPEWATKMYIAGSLGMMSGLILVVCAGVGQLNRNTPNRSALLNCVVRFATIISCTCNEPGSLP